MTGADLAWQSTMERIRDVTATQSHVTFFGEPGSGRKFAATTLCAEIRTTDSGASFRFLECRGLAVQAATEALAAGGELVVLVLAHADELREEPASVILSRLGTLELEPTARPKLRVVATVSKLDQGPLSTLETVEVATPSLAQREDQSFDTIRKYWQLFGGQGSSPSLAELRSGNLRELKVRARRSQDAPTQSQAARSEGLDSHPATPAERSVDLEVAAPLRALLTGPPRGQLLTDWFREGNHSKTPIGVLNGLFRKGPGKTDHSLLKQCVAEQAKLIMDRNGGLDPSRPLDRHLLLGQLFDNWPTFRPGADGDIRVGFLISEARERREARELLAQIPELMNVFPELAQLYGFVPTEVDSTDYDDPAKLAKLLKKSVDGLEKIGYHVHQKRGDAEYPTLEHDALSAIGTMLSKGGNLGAHSNLLTDHEMKSVNFESTEAGYHLACSEGEGKPCVFVVRADSLPVAKKSMFWVPLIVLVRKTALRRGSIPAMDQLRLP